MFTKGDIRRVSVVISGEDYRELIVMLGKSGLVQIDRDISDEAPADEKNVNNAGLSLDTGKAGSIYAAAVEYLSEDDSAEYKIPDYDSIIRNIPSLFSRNTDSDLKETVLIKKKREQYKQVRAMIMQEIHYLKMKLGEIRILNEAGIDLSEIRKMKNLSFIYGLIGNMDWLDEIDKNWFYIISNNHLLCIFPQEDNSAVMDIFRGSRFENLNKIVKSGYPAEETEIQIEARVRDLEKRLGRLDQYYKKELVRWKERMAYLLRIYSVILKIAGAESSLRFSHEIVLINGWVNYNDVKTLSRILHDKCGERFYLNVATKKENRRFRGRIPVLLKNSRIFRPFELLVRMMGFPGNSEVDPTPAAAIAYVVIFGVMFGDAGQGLVLALSGFFINLYGMRKYGERNNISDFGSIMVWCGFSAVLFGFLYGSVFSNEHLIPAILFHPMENMMQLFFMVIMMGAFFISAGLLINIFNGMIAGHYEESLFGTKGAAGLAVYVSFIFFAVRYIFKGIFPGGVEIIMAAAVPAALFWMRGPLGFIIFHGDKLFPHGLFEYIVESLIEIIEMFSGFLGNTISFIRAGAFALSHAGLSIAVYTLAEIIDPSMKGAGAVIVIVLGNIFIIALEGLVCAIQSMRLEYYEFFGKFFKGDGAGFAPFSLRFK